MGQLNVYVPDDLEEKIKKRAQERGKSVSAFVVEAVRKEIAPESWSPQFLTLLESEPTDFEEPADIPLQKRPGLDDL